MDYSITSQTEKKDKNFKLKTIYLRKPNTNHMSVAGIITHILIIIIGLIILAMVLPSTLNTPHDYRKKSAQEIEAERKKRKQYENYYRTGNRRFLYDPDFKG